VRVGSQEVGLIRFTGLNPQRPLEGEGVSAQGLLLLDGLIPLKSKTDVPMRPAIHRRERAANDPEGDFAGAAHD